MHVDDDSSSWHSILCQNIAIFRAITSQVVVCFFSVDMAAVLKWYVLAGYCGVYSIGGVTEQNGIGSIKCMAVGENCNILPWKIYAGIP